MAPYIPEVMMCWLLEVILLVGAAGGRSAKTAPFRTRAW